MISVLSFFSLALTLAPMDVPSRESDERGIEESALKLSDLEALFSNKKLSQVICEWGAQEFCTLYCNRQREHSFADCMNGLDFWLFSIEGCLEKVRNFCEGFLEREASD